MRAAHFLFRVLTPALALGLVLFATPPAQAQVDTLAFGNIDLGSPVVATLQFGDIVPPYGAVHVAWRQGATRTLMHAWKDPGAWQTEMVADSANSPDIAVRGDGLASLAYFDLHGRLIYAERSPSGWSLDTVTTCPGAILTPSLAIGSEPALAYLAGPLGGPTALNYARRSGSGWTVIELDSLDARGIGNFAPSLALGPQGQPTVAYLKTAATGTGYELVVLEGAGPLGPFTPTVLDTEAIGPAALTWDTNRQRPMVLYGTSPSGFEYRLAWRDVAGQWEREPVGTYFDNFTWAGVSLALDPVGNLGALWLHFQSVSPNLTEGLESCGSIGNVTNELSRQPAGVPTTPFTTTSVARVLGFDTRISQRALSSSAYGTFDMVWLEPRTPGHGCDPHAIFYQELSSGTTAVPLDPVRTGTRLELVPNPVATGAALRLRWTQPRAGEARLEAHDLAGRRVASLAVGRITAGAGERTWDLRELSPGVYWVSLLVDGERTARNILIRR